MSHLINQLQTQEGAFEWVESIILDIENGNRLHDQRLFHIKNDCGTAHCIAGWVHNDILESIGCSLSLQEYEYEYEPERFTYPSQESEINRRIKIESILKKYFDEEVYEKYSNSGSMPIWSMALAVLRISEEDSDLIFEGDLTINEIKNNFKCLKEKYLDN